VNQSFFSDLLKRKSPLIIAEIGANYGGIDTMKAMVNAAAVCGVDMVKFQTYRAETISTPGSYFTMEDGSELSQYDFFKAYELGKEEHEILNSLCVQIGVDWTSTPSHISDLDLLEKYNLPCYKTGSDDLTNLPFLRAVAEKGRPMLVSTGMCSLGEIEAAVKTIFLTGNQQLVLLHCVVSYPSRIEDANLRVIETLRNAFGVPIGLSDHTQDEFTSILATQMGAVVIEKHFTLDHALGLPDHEASLNPEQFRKLVERVRMVPNALGSGVKYILPTEEKWRKAARKSLYAAIDITEGLKICEEHIAIRRPSDGIHPHHLPLLIGRIAKESIPAGSLIKWEMV
jgi:hypothetical protein